MAGFTVGLVFAGSLAVGRAGWTPGAVAGLGAGTAFAGFGVLWDGAVVGVFEPMPGRGNRGAAVGPAGLLVVALAADVGRGFAGTAADEACSIGAF